MSKRVRLANNNICGKWIRHVRKGLYDKQHPKMTQEELTAKLQLLGLRIDRTALSRIESGERILSDIEVACFASALNVPLEFLFFGADGTLPEITEFVSMVAEEEERI